MRHTDKYGQLELRTFLLCRADLVDAVRKHMPPGFEVTDVQVYDRPEDLPGSPSTGYGESAPYVRIEARRTCFNEGE